MKNYREILAFDPSKIDRDEAIALLEYYRASSEVLKEYLPRFLIHISVLERIFELIRGKEVETKKLIDIVGTAMTHCIIASSNPISYLYDSHSGESIPGPKIYSQEYIDHINDILPLIEDFNTKVLAALNK